MPVACPHCGHDNERGERFCSTCNAFLGFDDGAPASGDTTQMPGPAPTGQYPTPAPTGQYPGPAPTGQYPTPAPTGQYPGPAPTGQFPTPAPRPDAQHAGVQLRLERDKIKVVPGGAESTAFTVKNQGTQVEQFRLLVSGPDWLVIEPDTLSVYPGQEATGTVQAAPQRTPASTAGVTPFRLTVTSAIHPNLSGSVSGQIDVAPFYEFTAELAPTSRSGKGWTRHRVNLSNQGNVPLRVVLNPADVGDELQLSMPSVALVQPGQVARVPMRVHGRRWFGKQSETKTFSLTAEPPKPLDTQRMAGTRTVVPTFPKWVRTLAVLVIVVAIAAIAAAKFHLYMRIHDHFSNG